MAAGAIIESSDSSEEISSNKSNFYYVNLYDSDVTETSEPSEEAGPCPYRYENMDNNNKAVRTKLKVSQIVLATQTGNWFCDLDKEKPEDRQGAVYKIKCCDCQASYIAETGRNLSTQLIEYKQTTKNGDVNNHIAEHHLQTKHQIDWDCDLDNVFYRLIGYIAYPQLVRWCWGCLGRKVRVALPSCAVNKICQRFPADFGTSYTGSKQPNLH